MANRLTISSQLAYAKARGYLPAFSAAARQTGIDRNLLLAVASRESAMGKTLSPTGYGDNGNGIGIMQIDRRYHPNYAAGYLPLDTYANVQKGAEILRSELDRYGGNRQYALDAYNAGAGNVAAGVNQGMGPDFYTTAGNYGSDVLRRYGILQGLSGQADGGSKPAKGHKALKIVAISGGAVFTIAAAGYVVWQKTNWKLPDLNFQF
jgi:soluble lytic murein transglycosylase-like protein